jgi:hypothetical protein
MNVRSCADGSAEVEAISLEAYDGAQNILRPTFDGHLVTPDSSCELRGIVSIPSGSWSFTSVWLVAIVAFCGVVDVVVAAALLSGQWHALATALVINLVGPLLVAWASGRGLARSATLALFTTG